jgi:hypothetical protein
MSILDRTPRVVAVLAALAIASVAAVGCGDDDEDSGGDDTSKVTITATGGEGSQTFEVDPGDLIAGAAEIELVNDSETPVDGQLGYVSGDYTEEEVAEQFSNAVTGRKPVEDWFQGGGGPGTTEPGATGSVTQDLQPGTYYVLPGNDLPEPPLAKFTVADGDGADLPETDGTVTAVDYSFSGDGLTAGSNEVTLQNDGEQWHHFLAAKLKDDATIEQAQEFLQSEGQGGGPPPFEGDVEAGNAVESTVMEGGTSQVVTAEFEPGTYAFFCFIADKQGGPPHVVKGMVSEVEVSE